MGDGVVVLPKAIDEVVGERRDRRDRLRGIHLTAGHAGGVECQLVWIAVVAKLDVVRPIGLQRALARRGLEWPESPDLVGKQIVLLHRSGPSAGRCAESQSTRHARIAPLTLVYQPDFVAHLLCDALRRKAESLVAVRRIAGPDF